jgi:hypothetical protein
MLGINAVYGIEFFMSPISKKTNREQALLTSNRDDRVVAMRSTSSGVNKQVDGLVENRYRGFLGKHDVEEFALENLLT